jgi:hypothetical protein
MIVEAILNFVETFSTGESQSSSAPAEDKHRNAKHQIHFANLNFEIIILFQK